MAMKRNYFFNLLKIQTIIIRNKIEQFCNKLPFEEQLFEFQ